MNKVLITEQISHAVHNKDPHAEIYLFGSRARGDNKTDSDWDILILVDEEKITNKIEDNFRDDIYDIELDSGQIISTFIYPKKYWGEYLAFSPLYNNVTKEGIRL